MRDQAGPLPAQPYILVLWATHIGRYAIKHSPSESARASEPSRAIVKVLGTLCEHPLPSPLATLSLSGAPPHGTAPRFSHPADYGRPERRRREARERETRWCPLEIPLLVLPLRPTARPRQRKMARFGRRDEIRERTCRRDMLAFPWSLII